MIRWASISVCALVLFYVAAFVVIHKTTWLRRPAMNMAYFYYSDNATLQTALFYGFWPLRQLGYHTPWFRARHEGEREPSDAAFDGP